MLRCCLVCVSVPTHKTTSASRHVPTASNPRCGVGTRVQSCYFLVPYRIRIHLQFKMIHLLMLLIIPNLARTPKRKNPRYLFHRIHLRLCHFEQMTGFDGLLVSIGCINAFDVIWMWHQRVWNVKSKIVPGTRCCRNIFFYHYEQVHLSKKYFTILNFPNESSVRTQNKMKNIFFEMNRDGLTCVHTSIAP